MTKTASPRSTGFRTDINGLRAWAIAAVVLFHFDIPVTAGGFVGVDVFFVISGFLMSGIIVKGLEGGRFSLAEFYLGRARRILPALVAMTAVLLAVGWFILMSLDYEALGNQVYKSLLFISNLGYLQDSGYFDGGAQEKWLLHSWSLSVEWQLYLLLPILLLAVWRTFPRRRALVLAHALPLLASLGICLYLTATRPERAFYVLESRAWEFLVGGLVYLLGDRRLSAAAGRLAELAGLALIVAASVLLDASSPWPGSLALLPTLGAALILLARRQHSVWTGNPVAQWLGTRSYSIYLWHWPVVVALAYYEHLDEPAWVAAGLLASLLLGQLSYAWVEVPAQRLLQGLPARRAVALVLLATVPVLATGRWVKLQDGLSGRLPAAVSAIDAQANNRNPRYEKCHKKAAACIFGGDSIRFLMLGDSHASAVVTAAQAALPNPQEGIYYHSSPGCLLVLGAKDVDQGQAPRCQHLRQSLHETLARFPGLPVVVVNRTSMYALGYNEDAHAKPQVFFSSPTEQPSAEFLEEFRQHYLETACEIAREHPLFLMRPIPEMIVNVPRAIGRALLMGETRDVVLDREAYRSRNAFVWSLQDEARERCGARILDPLPYLCDERFCYGSHNGLPIYYDDDHLNEYGNRLLLPMFTKALEAMGGHSVPGKVAVQR